MLDTNVYIDIERVESFARSARAFAAFHIMQVSSVVFAELLLGSGNGVVQSHIIGNLEVEVEIAGALTPDADDWRTAAIAWTRMTPKTTERRSFWNDLLLAASCSRTGATIVTANHADFKRIARHIPVRHIRPWPH